MSSDYDYKLLLEACYIHNFKLQIEVNKLRRKICTHIYMVQIHVMAKWTIHVETPSMLSHNVRHLWCTWYISCFLVHINTHCTDWHIFLLLHAVLWSYNLSLLPSICPDSRIILCRTLDFKPLAKGPMNLNLLKI